MGGHNEQDYRQRSGLLEDVIIPLSRRLRQIAYLKAIRESFCLMMPVIILLTLIHMTGYLLCNPTGPLLGEDWLGLGSVLTDGLHDQAYRESSFFAFWNHIREYLEVTNILNSLLFAMVLTVKLADLWQGNKYLALICTVAAYLFLITAFPGNGHELALYFTGRGFFLALLIATFSTLMFSRLSRLNFLQLPVVPGLPHEMALSLKLLIPLSCTLLASLLTAFAWISVESSLLSLPTLLANSINESVAQSPALAIGYELIRRLLWWLGLNGNSLTYFWSEAFYIPAQTANEIAGGKFVFTAEFFDATSISLPFLFALPIVLNPMFLVPYLLAPMLNVLVGWLAIHWDIVPLFRYTVESNAPVLLQGWLATGDIMGAVLQLVWLSLDIVIYTPFVIIFNLLTQDEDQPEEAHPHEA